MVFNLRNDVREQTAENTRLTTNRKPKDFIHDTVPTRKIYTTKNLVSKLLQKFKNKVANDVFVLIIGIFI